MRYCLLLVACLCAPSLAAPLTLGIRGHQVEQTLISLVALPGEELRIGLFRYHDLPLILTLDGQASGERTENAWHLQAPRAPGLYKLRVARPDTGNESLVHLWVAVPASRIEGDYLEGYRLGQYPGSRPNRSNYDPPQGFIRVTEENLNTRVSEHFTLRQFLCKQQSGYPKYVLLQEGLLLLLERLLTEVNERGYEVDTFGIISGYRTPWYNKSIGNVRYSRHVYGDAMDIYVDADGDGRMDDLNGDGTRNMADIKLFYDIVEAVKARPENVALVGGVGKYARTSRHGGFVHVDTRGYRARW